MKYKKFIMILFLFFSAGVLAQEPAEIDLRVTSVSRPHAVIETSMGTIRVELFADRAPNTVRNFIQYANDDFYVDTIFHRVIQGFMIQGGGFGDDMKQRFTRAPVKNEADNGLTNERGTLVMARTSEPHSATSQFFINHTSNRSLNHRNKDSSSGWGYTVFGRVLTGMDVVDAIAAAPTGPIPPFGRDVPLETIYIRSITIITV